MKETEMFKEAIEEMEPPPGYRLSVFRDGDYGSRVAAVFVREPSADQGHPDVVYITGDAYEMRGLSNDATRFALYARLKRDLVCLICGIS